MMVNSAITETEDNDAPIEDLDLWVRTYNCLKRSNINTVRQLFAMSKEKLLGIRNFGPQNYEEVRERLITRGLYESRPAERTFRLAGEFTHSITS
jgi:DNA-directed RNA polymerase subunit alpha